MELWLDGDLDDEASRVLEAHLLRCPSCRDWLAMRQELGGRLRVLGRSALEAGEGAGQHPLGLLPMRGPGWAAFWLLGILALGGIWYGTGRGRLAKPTVLQAEITVVDDVRTRQDIFITENRENRTFRIHCQVLWSVDGEAKGGTDE